MHQICPSRTQIGSSYLDGYSMTHSASTGLIWERGRQTARNLIFFDAPIAAFFTVDRRLEAGSWFDCGLLAQTFMLAAKARGLDTCPQIFLTKYHSVVRQHLPIDDSQIMLCGMSIGYADTSSVEYTINMPRIPVDEFASIIGLE